MEITAPAVDVPQYSLTGGVRSDVVSAALAVKATNAGAASPGRWRLNSRTLSVVLEVIRTATVVPGGTSGMTSVASQLPFGPATVSATPHSLAMRIAELGWAV